VAFFGLIEIIAKENGHKVTGDLEISPAYLKRKLRISQTKLKQIFGFCSTKGKLFSDFSKEKWKFNFPKIAELKDNYTKDLQVTGKKLSKHKEVEEEVEVEVYKPPVSPKGDSVGPKKILLKRFETFWSHYPKKKSKGQAEKTWLKLKPTKKLLKIITDAVDQAKTSEDWLKDNGQFIPHPSTWLNAKGWEDEHTATGRKNKWEGFTG
jgi:hypothetical protein